MSETNTTQDSLNNSSSTNTSNSEVLIQDINDLNSKNYVIISKNLEPKIPDILSYLQNNSNLALNKIIIVKYLQKMFLTININSEIFLRKLSSEKEKLNLCQIIVGQYITYTNNLSNENDENNYRKELLILFDILLSQVTIDRESYHYILTFLLKFLNEKNNNSSLTIKEEEEESFHLTAEHLKRILTLLQKFYQFLDENKMSLNYFFFNGESGSSITIQNKNSIKDNKKLLTFEDNLCILMFIKVFPSEYIKVAFPNTIFNLLELKFNEKNKDKDISVHIDVNNNLITNIVSGTIAKLSENDTNWLLIKFKKKKKIKVKFYLNGRKIYYKKDKDKDKEKDKEEIKEIILFKNFIGICYNFMIFKTKKKEIYPKFLENEVKKNNFGSSYNTTKDDHKKKILMPVNRTNYYNGFINEELLFPFIKTEFKDEIEHNILDNLFNYNDSNINNNDIKDFLEKIIAIYMPSRVIIPSSCKKYNLSNTPQLIIEDSINGLDAEFETKNPSLNGLHLYKRMIDDFGPIGGLNNLLPILEIMTKYTELLTKENLGLFFDMLISIFVPQYQKALLKESNSNFFLYLSYFFEKIPETYYDDNLIGIFKSISSFLTTQINENNYFIELTEQFHNNILMNESILFKFNHEEQKDIIEIITNVIKNIDPDKKALNVDIITIIKIILHLDENKNTFFCCKKHSEYFTENYGIMEPELNIRLQPIEELLQHLFDEFKEKVKNKDPTIKSSNLYKLFTLLTYDISPCIQKMIIKLFSSVLEHNYKNYCDILDKDEQLLNISLFVLKNSIFDIKEDILNLIFIILKNGNSNQDYKQKSIFISNYVLPFYLFVDNELIQIISENNDKKKEPPIIKSLSQENLCKGGIDNLNQESKVESDAENKNKIKNEMKLIEDYFEKENKDDSAKYFQLRKQLSKEQDIFNDLYMEDDINNSISKLNGIKLNTTINKTVYSLTLLNANLIKIHSIYNKNKLEILINDLFNIIYKFFHEGILIKLSLNLLSKIVAKGDLLLVSSFLEKLQQEINNIKTEQDKKK